jgi:hypothetical protein
MGNEARKSEHVTTARAIEVCLSRLRMPIETARHLSYMLAQERRTPSKSNYVDPDAFAADLHGVLYHLDGLDESFPKNAMVARVVDARAAVRAIIDGLRTPTRAEAAHQAYREASLRLHGDFSPFAQRGGTQE